MFDQRRETIERLHHLFLSCPEPGKRERPEGWSVREVIGHLIDSASNNHQRVSRYIPGGNLSFPAYDQDTFVRRAGYDSLDCDTLVALWHGYNLLFLHMIELIPEEQLRSSTVTIGEHPPLTLWELTEKYFEHMERHERQVKRILETK
ncbi:MAG: DinB family protein [Candidatus Latescibacterota bacterium]